MNNLEILYFEQLKKAVESKYLENHTPSDTDIKKWKGIDIIYFQEDLRKFAKGNISEKSFYTYFKTSPVNKLPRIDMLNLLSNYINFDTWYSYKNANPINDITEDFSIKEQDPNLASDDITLESIEDTKTINEAQEITKEIATSEVVETPLDKKQKNIDEKTNIQINDTVNQHNTTNKTSGFFRKNIWYITTSILLLLVLFLIFRDHWLTKEFTYSFIDSDRNTLIKDELDVKILKENESPITFRVKPNAPFRYTTKSKSLTMIVSSPFYRTDTIKRNLESAQSNENIELKPNDYAILLYYYSRSIKDFKKKREQLSQLISDNAEITQVYDNETYGVERLDKQKYISLVTLPTTALENLNVIDTQMRNGKIVLIRFKISNNE